jgi:4-hydroxythreonine-4-phosphate dehydrogenase|tara:strand:+ start:1556 stop:2587 length:1032 start_codon:yes stop_codon:yes gene_type:complete
MKLPLIAITMGDPAGIGPEIIIKALSQLKTYSLCRPVVVGDASVLEDACNITHRSFKINSIKHPKDGKFKFGIVDTIDLGNVEMSKLQYGQVSAMCGKASGEYIEKTINLALSNEVKATVTAPIHKEAFRLGGWGEKYAGHTEMYADLTKTKHYSMMLAHGNFRTVHVTTHVSLLEACKLIKKDRVLDVIRIANDACLSLGITEPKIGVAGLNPHAGDNGLFGSEEVNAIEPAIKVAQKEGMNVQGPVPADTIYSKAIGGWYDIVVSMYHDQGHIPMKLSGFQWDEGKNNWKTISGVNVTLGLPIIRVSVDHGTAFGKAGKGIASSDSMIDAIKMAIEFVNSK